MSTRIAGPTPKNAKPSDTCQHGVRVVAPARLHLGFLDLNGNLGRRFGSLGLAIDRPATEIVLQRADRLAISGAEGRRAEAALKRYCSLLGLKASYRLHVEQAIPAHAGLGSGTQLAMAVGAGLAALEDLETELRALGEMQSRGARSAIGMAAFERGGFVVDGGRGSEDNAPPIIVRAAFPTDWRIVLALDPERVGVHGAKEATAFETLAPMPEDVSAEMCRVTLLQLLPALVECDIEAFGAAVSVVQRFNGSYFSSAQGGGIWSSQRVAGIVKRMQECGAVGIGQSSWGPTGFAFVPSQARALELCQTLKSEAGQAGVELMIARGRNQGGFIEPVTSYDPLGEATA